MTISCALSFYGRGAVALLLAVGSIGCRDEPGKAEPPAKVTNAVPESDLAAVTLTMQAVQRLGIETATVESAAVPPTRTVGGEIVVPPGHTVKLVAPVGGMVLPPAGGSIPMAGARVQARQTLLRLVPLTPNGDLLQEIAVASARLRAAELEFERVEKLYADRLVSARERERAQADLAEARAAMDAANARQNLARTGTAAENSGITPLLIAAPESGILSALSVAPGQSVAAGAALGEIVQLSRLWVRVPVYAGDAARFNRRIEATVHGLGSAALNPIGKARAVTGPPSADAAAASVDLYYEVTTSQSLRPGERVGITIPLVADAERALVIPLASVVYDMNGGAWVYERVDSTRFVRRRVEIARVVSGNAVLSRGPQPGTRIVTAGTAELFGTEFGTGK
jgi:RND family efflux transporter MFP subunit